MIDVLLPALPAEIGGGSTKTFTQGILWAAIGFDLPPEGTAVRVVVQSASADAAASLDRQLAVIRQMIGQRADVRDEVPNFGKLMAAGNAGRSGDRLVLEVSEDDGDLSEFSSLLAPLFKVAQRMTARRTATAELPKE